MEKRSAQKKTWRYLSVIFTAALNPFSNRRSIFFPALFFAAAAYGQAPNISYSSPQNYTAGTTITPLVPTSSGVATPGYSGRFTLGGGFKMPIGVAVDAAGNVYVSDRDNNAVKKIPAGGGAVVTLGSGFSSPQGVAVDTAGNVYVADQGSNTVKKIPAGGGAVTTLASGFDIPFGLAVDASGFVYVTDYGNSAVKKIPPGGGATVTLGSGFKYPTGVVVDAYGNVYVADYFNNAVKKIPVGGGAVVTLGSGFSLPIGVAVDPSGNVFVADLGNAAVKEIRASGGAPITIIAPDFSYVLPYGIAVDMANNVYVTNDDVVQEIKPIGGFYISPALPAGLGFANTTGIISGTPTTVSPATNYTVTAYNSSGSSSATVNIAVKFPPLPTISYTSPQVYTEGVPISPLTPTSSSVAAPAYSSTPVTLNSGFNVPIGLTVDAAGNIYVADRAAGTVSKIPAGGGAPVTLASGFSYPGGVAIDAAGNVYVSEGSNDPANSNNAVKEIPAGGGAVITLATGFKTMYGVAVDSLGFVYVADYGGNAIRKIPPGGAGAPVTLGSGFLNPTGVAVDAYGNVYVADYGNGAVKKIPAGGGAIVNLGSGFLNPGGVAVDPSGNVFVAEYSDNGTIKEIPVSGGPPIIVSSIANGPFGVAVDVANNLYVAVSAGGTVQEIKPIGGYYISPALPSGLKFDNTTGVISGTPTTISPAANYNVTAYNVSGSAAATVNIKVLISATDVDLSALQISSGTLTPGFAPGITSYTASVSNTVSSIAVTPTTSAPGATVNVNGSAVTSGTASANIPLNAGPNTITTIVTALDGTTTQTYTLTINRAADATLKGITLSTGSTPTFSGNGNYTASVSPSTTTLTLTPIASDPNATITVNGVAVTSGAASQSIAINNNPTIINIQVTGVDGVTEKNYTVTISKNGSSDAGVDIALSTGSTLTRLSSNGTVNDYTASVPAGTSSLTVIPTASDPNAKITVDGVSVASGTASQSIAINTNPTIITVQVTAQDGVTVRTNSISVYKNGSSNAGLSVELSTGSMLTYLSSANNVNYYSASVPAATGALTVTPTAADPNATITVNGIAVASGTASQSIAISTNPTVITVQLTAQDGTTIRTRSITIYKNGSSDAGFVVSLSTGSKVTYLSSSAQTFYYSASVTAGTSSLTVTPTAVDPNAVITVNGVAVASGTASETIALNANPTIITVQVTAQDGVTVRTHSISVYQEASPPPALNSAAIGVTQPMETPLMAEDGIKVHNGISPNGDGIDDFLQIDNISQYPDNKLTIMNRSGQLIYEAKGYDNSSKIFDGHSNKNGAMQLPGTYFYQLDYTVSGITKHKTGFIVLKY